MVVVGVCSRGGTGVGSRGGKRSGTGGDAQVVPSLQTLPLLGQSENDLGNFAFIVEWIVFKKSESCCNLSEMDQ